jgi:hypothetical protein
MSNAKYYSALCFLCRELVTFLSAVSNVTYNDIVTYNSEAVKPHKSCPVLVQRLLLTSVQDLAIISNPDFGLTEPGNIRKSWLD